MKIFSSSGAVLLRVFCAARSWLLGRSGWGVAERLPTCMAVGGDDFISVHSLEREIEEGTRAAVCRIVL